MKIIKETKCTFCSLGCGLKIETVNGSAIAMHHGSLCPRGNYVLELLTHPKRLESPKEGKKEVSFEEAIESTLAKLKGIDPAQIGVIASGMLPCEDLFAAAKFTEEVLKSENFEITWVTKEDDDEINLPALPAPALETLDTLLIVGDPLTHSAVLSKYINKVKYGKRENRIIVIDSKETHTSWFAGDFLKVPAQTESLLLLAVAKLGGANVSVDVNEVVQKTGIALGRIQAIVETLKKSAACGVIVSLGCDNPIVTKAAKLALSVFPGAKGYFVTYTIGNALGAKKILQNAKTTHVIQKLLNGELKALFLFGEDLLSSFPTEEMRKTILGLSLLVTTEWFEDDCCKIGQICFPLASYTESLSTFLLSGNNQVTLEPVTGPRALSATVRDIVLSIGEKLNPGWKIDYALLSRWLSEKSEQKTIIQEIVEASKKPVSRPRPEYAHLKEDSIVHIGNRSLTRNFNWAKIKG
ncbi:MAG: hypothetical protein NT099_01215 [Candidatus Saganbacteria bacterium]|nr:hypothetical protein [Candidatus Saganbacteria bacterium]